MARVKDPGRNKRRQEKAAKLKAKGMESNTALLKAGYSKTYVAVHGGRILQRPMFRSMFTDLIEEGLRKRNKEFQGVVDPYLDGLDAVVVVKSQTEGIATLAVDPETRLPIPDHDIRIKAADRIIGLYGGVPKESEIPPEPQPGMTIIINKDGGAVQVNQQTVVDRTKIEPTGEETLPPMPAVTIKKG